MTLNKADRAKLATVHPDLARVIERAAADGAPAFRVLEGVRSQERQAQLLREGATTTMNSRHLTGHAVDIAPLAGGQVSWAWPMYYPLAKAIKAAAKAEGVKIEWGGDWKSFKDGPHWQLPWRHYPIGQGLLPTRERLSESRTIQGGGVAAASVVSGGALGLISEAQSSLQQFSDLDLIRYALMGLALAGVAYMIWARIDDWRRGAR